MTNTNRTPLATNFRNVALAIAARTHTNRMTVGDAHAIVTQLPRLADNAQRELFADRGDYGAQRALESFLASKLPRIVMSITTHGHGPIRYCREDINGVPCTCA